MVLTSETKSVNLFIYLFLLCQLIFRSSAHVWEGPELYGKAVMLFQEVQKKHKK